MGNSCSNSCSAPAKKVKVESPQPPSPPPSAPASSPGSASARKPVSASASEKAPASAKPARSSPRRSSKDVCIGAFTVDLAREIGDGGFGKVYNATCKDMPGAAFVAKKMYLTRDSQRVFDNEVEVLKHMFSDGRGHSSIIRLHEHALLEWKGKREGWMIMEKATGGELFDLLSDGGPVRERSVRPLIRSVVAGIQYMHRIGVVHRDLKLENIMLCAEDPTAAKIIDFGLATRLRKPAEEKMIEGDCGSEAYRAPEMLREKGVPYLGPPVDVWALGITLFSLLSGFFPVQHAHESDWRFAKLRADQRAGVGACKSLFAQYKRKCKFSEELQELIDAMLQIDVSSRPDIDAVAEFAWLQKHKPMYRDLSADDEDEDDDEPEPLEESMLRIGRQKAFGVDAEQVDASI